jgi:hypothetical protein
MSKIMNMNYVLVDLWTHGYLNGSFNNARERDAHTRISLLIEADPWFQSLGITMPPEARIAIIKAEWTGE